LYFGVPMEINTPTIIEPAQQIKIQNSPPTNFHEHTFNISAYSPTIVRSPPISFQVPEYHRGMKTSFSLSPNSASSFDDKSPRSCDSIFESEESWDDCGLENDASSHLYGLNLEDKSKGFRLGTSKSPVIDALVYCALMEYGLKLTTNNSQLIQFQIDDFNLYYRTSKEVCSKAHPTDDMYSRVKALRRWFPDFPCWKDISQNEFVTISMRNKGNKTFAKLQSIIEKQKSLLAMSSDGVRPGGGPSLASCQDGQLKRSR